MRTPSTAVRGVFVILIILGVVFLSNIGITQSVAGQQAALVSVNTGRVLLDVPTPTAEPTAEPTETPNLQIYYPVMNNNFGYLYSSVVIGQGHQAVGGVIGRAVPEEVLQEMRDEAEESRADSSAEEAD